MTDTGCLKYGRPSTFVPYRQSSLGRAADLRGQQFGEFTVITQAKSEVLINKKGRKTCRAAWLCRCACGAQQVVTATRLRVGYAVRCAHCNYRLRPQSRRQYDDYEVLFRRTKTSASSRGIRFELSLEEFELLVKADCHYCGASPVLLQWLARKRPIVANGVDRTAGACGYVSANCVPCCKTCNFAKHTLGPNEFIEHCRRVVAYADRKAVSV